MTTFDLASRAAELGLTIVLGGISKGLVASKNNLSGGEFEAAVMIEAAAINILSQTIAAPCDDCKGTGLGTEKSGEDHCYCCLGSGKLLDQGVSHDLYTLAMKMYNFDDIFGDYLSVEIKNAITAAGITL